MRLVCPNCGAQYEVDDRVVPEAGRDVQCSACGHSWYQLPLDHPGAMEEPALGEDAVLPGDAEATEFEPEMPGQEAEPPETGLTEPEPAAPRRREIDEGVRGILQEEAQREIEARELERKHEPEPVETQPELGLGEGPSASEERQWIAADDELEETEDSFQEFETSTAADTESTRGRDLFPDIEEINSTLDSHGVAAAATTVPPGERRSSGFLRGFTLVIVLAVVALAIYRFAPEIAARVPALEPALAAYVDAVNNARAALDALVRGLLENAGT